MTETEEGSEDVPNVEVDRPGSRPLDVHRHSEHPELRIVLSRLADEVVAFLKRKQDKGAGISVSVNGVAGGPLVPPSVPLSDSSRPSPSPSPSLSHLTSCDPVRKRGRPKGSLSHDHLMKVREHARRVLLDLILEQSGLDRLIGYSRRSERFKRLDSRYNKIHLSQRPLVRAVDALGELGYLSREKGERDKATKKLFSPTIIGTEKLREAWAQIPNPRAKHSRDPDEETIILRDVNDVAVEYDDTAETEAMRTNLCTINDRLKDADIRLRVSDTIIRETDGFEGFNLQAKKLVRIFKLGKGDTQQHFTRGGRFYRGWWENIPSDFRDRIEIDGQPCAEVDYSGLHFTLMYSRLGLICPADPYALPDVDAPRSLIKAVANIMINADTPSAAGSGIWNHCLGECLLLPEVRALPKEQRRAAAVERARLLNEKAKPLKQPVRDLHEPIKDFFSSGEGARLQFTDSKIAELVMLRMPVPVLPVHDSFLVNHNYHGQLIVEMERAYIDVVGELSELNCSMKFDRAATTEPIRDMSDWTTYLLEEN